jgi:phosphocarrier protein
VTRASVRIVNKRGLHMRAANIFAEAAGRYDCSIHIHRDEMRVNGKSIMGLMMLAAPCGTEIMIEVEGNHEEEVLEDLTNLVRKGFGEELAEGKEGSR